TVISQGGLHLTMPPWRGQLSDTELDLLARFVVDPSTVPEGPDLFAVSCASCHGQRIPSAPDVDSARETIASGGAHETMPVWGEVLTPEQLEALVNYTLAAAEGAPAELAQQLYAQNCASCHGDFGEGGPNPARPGDVIAPISSEEYLQARDDDTLRAIIAQGQQSFGMPPYGSSYGGPLDDDEIDTLVAFMRAWEANPPVDLPPEVALTPAPLEASAVYAAVCAQCHGQAGEGLIGPSLNDPTFQSDRTDQQISDAITFGRDATVMIAWDGLLTPDQIEQLVAFIRQLSLEEPATEGEVPSFTADIVPILQAECVSCHGTLGDWDGTSYLAVMTTGDNAPVVIPGDAEGSLLAQKLIGTHTQGTIMPPAGMLPQTQIQVFLDWIAAGAPDN
ncbi:MAG: c-type cytochrome, partial [Anaerolineales bacterium]